MKPFSSRRARALLGASMIALIGCLTFSQPAIADEPPALNNSPESAFANAQAFYDKAKNSPCRTIAVDWAEAALSEDIAWMKAFLSRLGQMLNNFAFNPPPDDNRIQQLYKYYEDNQKNWTNDLAKMRGWLADLQKLPACPTPDVPKPAIPAPSQGPAPPVGPPSLPPFGPPPPIPNPPPGPCRTVLDEEYIEQLNYLIQENEKSIEQLSDDIQQAQKRLAAYQQELKGLYQYDYHDQPPTPIKNPQLYDASTWERIQYLEGEIEFLTNYIPRLQSLEQQYQHAVDEARSKLQAAGRPYCPPLETTTPLVNPPDPPPPMVDPPVPPPIVPGGGDGQTPPKIDDRTTDQPAQGTDSDPPHKTTPKSDTPKTTSHSENAAHPTVAPPPHKNPPVTTPKTPHTKSVKPAPAPEGGKTIGGLSPRSTTEAFAGHRFGGVERGDGEAFASRSALSASEAHAARLGSFGEHMHAGMGGMGRFAEMSAAGQARFGGFGGMGVGHFGGFGGMRLGGFHFH